MADEDSSFFKRIGVPSSVIALASTALTIAATMFAVDSRYAKADDVNGVSSKIEALAGEVNKLAGITQVLVQVTGRVERTHATPTAVMEPPYRQDSALPKSTIGIGPLVIQPELKLGDVLDKDAAEVQVEIEHASAEDVRGLLHQTVQSLERSKDNLNRLSSN